MENNFYIFTEIVNCGKIGKIALDSFHKYHNQKVHIYGTKEDFKWINQNNNNVFIEVDTLVIKGYKRGHVGTALLWEKIIQNCSSQYMIHFDSDVIFRKNIMDDMLEKAKEYDLIGPIRNYHHNPNNKNNIRHLTDLCQTNCTLFNLKKISEKYKLGGTKNNIDNTRKGIDISFRKFLKSIKYYMKRFLIKEQMSEFAQMIHGSYPLFYFDTLDFFDQVMFDMVMNGARIYHLDFNEVGGCDKYGKRNNIFKEINNFPTPYKIDFGSKLAHFSCVGSGMNFYNNKNLAKKIDSGYVKCALDRYALFCKTFYNEDLEGISLKEYSKITNLQNWY